MRKKMQRSMALLLALTMSFSLLGATAWATEVTGETKPDTAATSESAEEANTPTKTEKNNEKDSSQETASEETEEKQQEEQQPAAKPKEETTAEAEEKQEPEIVLSSGDDVVVDSGTCGQNLTWTLNQAGTLCISGSGEMKGWNSDGAPWYSQRKKVRKIEIEQGVTSVSDYAFRGCINLTSVTISTSVAIIGKSAFGGCSSLPSVTIPDSVTSIGNDAFELCRSLSSVMLGKNVTSIGSSAFWYCDSLTSITIPDSVTSIGVAFRDCNSLESIDVAEGNKEYCSINGILFDKNMSKLIGYPAGKRDSTYTIPNSVVSIERSAFYGCSNLKSIVIPDSVVSIGNSAFSGCSSLPSVTVPDSVTSIEGFAFSDCSGLTSMTIPDSMTSVSGGMFSGCSNLTSVTIPDSVTSIGGEAFRYCSSLASVTIPDSVTSIDSFAFGGCSSLTNMTIPDSVTNIGSYVFVDCKSLTNIALPNGLTKIPYNAFLRCSGLESIEIPDGVTSIEYDAFNGCSGLTSVTIPDSVTNIGENAFSGCRSTNVNILNLFIWCKIKFASRGANPLLYGGNLYLNGTLVRDMVIPYGITQIENYAFAGCSSLISVTLPESVNYIGGFAFYGCKALGEVKLSTKVTRIGDSAFSGCKVLDRLTLPEGVSRLGSCMIQGTNISSITIPKTVTYSSGDGSKNGALAGAAVLTDVVFADGIKKIPDYICASGSYTSAIERVVIPESVTSIGSYAFYNCKNFTIYGYTGSYAETYAKENNIRFRSVAVKKDATAEEVLRQLDVAKRFKDISMTGDNLKGPSVKIKEKEFSLFSFESGLKVSIGKHLQTVIDPEKKIVKVLIGFKPVDSSVSLDPSEEASGISGSVKRSKAFDKEYNDMKSFYRSVVGGKLTDGQIKNKLQALNRKLYDHDAMMGIHASAKISGYAEFSYATGEFQLTEGGVLTAMSMGVSYSAPIPAFPAAYIAASLECGLNGNFRLIKEKEYYSPEIQAALNISLSLGVGLGSKRAKTYVEGGMKGSLATNITYPKDSLAEALKVSLTGSLYIDSKVLGFDGPGYTHDFAKFQIYPRTSESDEVVTMNIDDLTPVDRSYLENGASTMDVDESAGEIYQDAAVYPYNNAQIVTLEDGTKLMVWVGDDGTKSSANKTSIMYATYDGSKWSAVQNLAENGRMNDYPILYQKNGAVYIVWQKGTKAFADDVTLTDVLKSTDLYYAVYQNGKMSDATRVSSGNNTYEMMQQVAVQGNEVSIAWVQNSENDVFMGEGMTSIILSQSTDGEWKEQTIYTGSKDVANLVMDYVNGKLTILYELGSTDSESEYCTDLYLYQDGKASKLAGSAENTMLINKMVYFIQNSVLYSYNLEKKSKTSMTLHGIADYDVIEKGNLIYVVTSVRSGYTDELYAYTYNKLTGKWSDAVQLTRYGKYIRNFSVTVDQNGTLTAALNLVDVNEKAESGTIYGDATLRVVTLGQAPDLMLEDSISYESSAVIAGNLLPLNLTVTNNGLQKVNGFIATFYDENGKTLGNYGVNAAIEAGDTATVQCLYQLPEEMSLQTITVGITAQNETALDDNKADVVIGYADLEMVNAYISGSASKATIQGTICNRGYETAENVTVQLMDGTDDSKVLGTVSFDAVAPGKQETFELALDKRYFNVLPIASGNTVKVRATSSAKEADYGNNERSLLIQSTEDEKMALNYRQIDLSVKQTIKLEVAYVASGVADDGIEWSSSDDTVASVDENGVVTAKKAGNAEITAKSGTLSAKCSVTVSEENTVGIYLSTNAVILQVGESNRITATAIPVSTNEAAIWSSDDQSVATVTSDGVITAIKGGKTTITAQVGTCKASCTVVVYGEEVQDTARNISFHGGDGASGIAPAAMTAEVNDVITLPANTFQKDGYQFVGWSDGTKTYRSGASYMVTGDVIFTAQWVKTVAATYTITASAGEGGSISPSGVTTIEEGGNCSFVITPNSGFEIVKVLIDGKNVGVIKTYTFRAVDEDHTITVTFKAVEERKQPQVVTAKAAKSTIKAGETTQITAQGYGTLTYKSSNEAVATVSTDGKVSGISAGTAIITVQASGNSQYDSGSTEVRITVIAVYANEITAANVTKVASAKAQSFSIGAKVKGGAKLTYKSNNKSITVDKNGKVTIAKNFVGKATITISAAATTNYNAAVKQIYVTVNPTGTKLSSVTSTKTGQLTIKWVKNAAVTGYQVQYATSSKFTGAKTLNVKSNKTVTSTLSKLKEKQKYYVRVRTYKTVGKVHYYSTWSAVKSAAVKGVTAPAAVKLTSVKSTKAGEMTVKWGKNAKAGGYQLQYATASNFKGAKTVAINKAATTSTTIKKLTKGKKYYVRVRTYQKVGSKTYYSAWSASKNVTIKK